MFPDRSLERWPKMMNHRFLVCALVIFLLTINSLLLTIKVQGQVSESDIDFKVVAEKISKEEITQHIKFFSSLQSRVSGYPGFFEAAEYVVSRFKEYNITPYGMDEEYYEFYNITVPVDLGASVRLRTGEVYDAYCVWPNYVNPSPYRSPPEGDLLIDVGYGEFKEYNKDVSGKWVLMDFNSRWYFRIAMALGAKGVIYIGRDETSRIEALQKLYDIPVYFPRMYVKEDVGEKLRSLCRAEDEIRIWVNGTTEWQSIRVPNIVGFIQGVGPQKDEAIVLSAFYDSWSIVPALSPGATDALGVSVLLEAARVMSENPPGRSIILLALSGHWQSLWGAREYVDRHFNSVGNKIKLFASLNLATDTDQLAIYNIGSTYAFFNVGSLNSRYSWLIDTLFVKYLPAMRSLYGDSFAVSFIDHIFYTHPSGIHQAPPTDFVGTFSFDSEPYVLACYGGGFAYHTTNAMRLYQRTPSDTFEKLNLRNLWPQAIFVVLSTWGFANEPNTALTQTPRRFGAADWGFSTLIVQVSEYNLKTAYWDPFDAEKHPELLKSVVVGYGTVPVATVFQARAGQLVATSGLGGPAIGSTGLIDIIVLPNSKGEAVIKGVKPYVQGFVLAFAVNKTDGRILWAPDFGVYAAPPFGMQTTVTSNPYSRLISIFPSGSIALFSILDPNTLLATTSTTINYRVNHGPMIHQSSMSSGYTDVIAFVEPETPTELLVFVGGGTTGVAGGGRPISALTNATAGDPQGSGYKVRQGQTLRLELTPREMARNIFFINDQRVETALKFSAVNPSVVTYHDKARNYLSLAEEAAKTSKFDLLYSLSFASWSYEQRSYVAMMDLIIQIIATAAIFFVFLIPAALIIQKLLSPSLGIKRFIQIILVFVSLLILLGLFHPGFYLASNVSVAILAVCIIAITLPLIGFVLGETATAAAEMRERIMGVHEASISRTGAVTHSISVCLENMKKRPFRSGLMMVSMILLTFSLISFTSLANFPIRRSQTWDVSPAYNGILVRKYPWLAIPEELYLQFDAQYRDKAIVAPRTWLFPPTPPGLGGVGRWYITPKMITSISGVLFLSPQEANITSVDKITIAEGRWFTPQDMYACLVSKSVSQNLTQELGREIEVGSNIPFLGLNLTVVGLYDDSLLWDGNAGVIDLDGEAITPMVPLMATGAQALAKPPHLLGNNIIIAPYRLALTIKESNWPVSISIKPHDPEMIPEIAADMALRIATDVVYATPNFSKVQVITYRQWITTIGLSDLAVPLIVCGLIMLNMMLGNVFERIREIRVYMSVGLSPLHVTTLFLAETVAYTVTSSVLGYILGISMSYAFTSMNLYPPDFYPNYASFFVILALLMAQGIAILSSFYPSYKASKLVTPSLERRWKMSLPTGDEWEVTFPFVATKEEASGILEFLKEYVSAYTTDRVGVFAARNLRVGTLVEKGEEIPLLEAEVLLAPFDLGLMQRFILQPYPIGSGRYSFRMHLTRLSGIREAWLSGNRSFIDRVRKQMLLWRVLTAEDKNRYADRFVKESSRS